MLAADAWRMRYEILSIIVMHGNSFNISVLGRCVRNSDARIWLWGGRPCDKLANARLANCSERVGFCFLFFFFLETLSFLKLF